MAVKVVDASVLAALAFGEPGADRAANLVSDCELYAPDLLHYELASIALKKSLNDPTQMREIATALEALIAFDERLAWASRDGAR